MSRSLESCELSLVLFVEEKVCWCGCDAKVGVINSVVLSLVSASCFYMKEKLCTSVFLEYFHNHILQNSEYL